MSDASKPARKGSEGSFDVIHSAACPEIKLPWEVGVMAEIFSSKPLDALARFLPRLWSLNFPKLRS